MSTLSITCDNCGSKWKLPESFSGATAKCQKCGSAIDVARQRAGDGEPAGSPAARPAQDRSKVPPPTRASRGERAPAAGRRPEREPARSARREGRRAESSPAGSRKGLWIAVGVLAAAALGGLGWWLSHR